MLNRRKLTRFITIALIALLSLGLSACQKEDTNPSVTTTPTTVPSTTAAPDMFTRDDLMAIMDEAGEIFKTGSYTIENPASFVSFFFRVNNQLNNYSETTESTILLSYDPNKIMFRESKGALQFGIFLHLVCSRYPDAICDSDYTCGPDTNRPYFGKVFFAPDYQKAGYETSLDYCKAIAEGEKVTVGHVFYIAFNKDLTIAMDQQSYPFFTAGK